MVLWFCKRPGLYYIGGSDVLPPPLKGEEEKKALAALEQGDEKARQLLVEHNLRLVVYIARRFENVSTGLEDLISIGTIGLIKAIGTYRLDKNIRLATYASRCIENEILMHIRKISGMKVEISLDEPINLDCDGNELLLSDILGTDGDEIARPLEDDVDLCVLRQALKELPTREREIVLLRFGLDIQDVVHQVHQLDGAGVLVLLGGVLSVLPGGGHVELLESGGAGVDGLVVHVHDVLALLQVGVGGGVLHILDGLGLGHHLGQGEEGDSWNGKVRN